MRIPTVEMVQRHQDRFPLVEHGAGKWEGVTWQHGACWLCRKPMLTGPQLCPQILRLRAWEGQVEMSLGFSQWVPLASMPWAAGAEWEAVDQRGHVVVE